MFAAGLVLAAVLAMTGLASAGGGDNKFTRDYNFDEDCNGFSSTGSNPYFIELDPGDKLTLAGEEDGEQLQVVIEVLNQTKTVDGVQTRVIRETETTDGKLVEISLNYFAICNRDNSVVYFGEDVDIYNKKGTEVVAHDGAWLAGEDGAKPGIVMPGTVLLGSRYYQELAPGVALDRAEHVAMNQRVKTPAGTFEETLKTRETTPLEKGVSLKAYARGVGLIQDGAVKLVEEDDN